LLVAEKNKQLSTGSREPNSRPIIVLGDVKEMLNGEDEYCGFTSMLLLTRIRRRESVRVEALARALSGAGGDLDDMLNENLCKG